MVAYIVAVTFGNLAPKCGQLGIRACLQKGSPLRLATALEHASRNDFLCAFPLLQFRSSAQH